jgi:hypothetical protein
VALRLSPVPFIHPIHSRVNAMNSLLMRRCRQQPAGPNDYVVQPSHLVYEVQK